MTAFADYLLKKFYSHSTHPYKHFERKVDGLVSQRSTLLDAGCGRTAPVLRNYVGRAERLIGVELVEFTDALPGIELYNANLSDLPLQDCSIDVIMSRSVFEHLTDPDSVYREFARVLKPGGRIVFLTANLWDYGTIVAMMVPNRFHAAVVRRVEGRADEDTFPTAYKTNSRQAVQRLAAGSGLVVEDFRYLSQYPNYLMFNGLLFLLGVAYEKLISRFEFLRILRGWILVTLVKKS